MNEYESAAMWKLYTQTSEGIAVQSTFARLRDSFRNAPEDVFIGLIDYLDYGKGLTDWTNAFNHVLQKRKSFEHERELRAIINIASESDPGKYVAVDMKTLVERVYVAPGAAPWFRELLASVLAKYDLRKGIAGSSLEARPLC